MLRSSLIAASAALVATTAVAQQTPQVLTQRATVTKRAKNLGTYHLATGTWTRPGQGNQANIVAGDIGSLYDNTCIPATGGIFAAIQASPTEVQVDTGQIPSTSNDGLGGTSSFVNLSDRYTVNGWRWGLCPGEPTGTAMDATFFFFESMNACIFTANPIPPELANVNNTALVVPNFITIGPLAPATPCYLFNLDIENTTFEFDINGDADMVHTAPGTDGQAGDTFGFGVQLERNDGMPFVNVTNNAVVLAGNKFGIATPPSPPCGAAGQSGFVAQSTRFLPGLQPIDIATGLGQLDGAQAFDPNAATPNACFFFGHSTGNGNPWAGFYAEIYGVPIGTPPVVFTEWCFGDGGVSAGCTSCPCGNDSVAGTMAGCLNHDARSADLNPMGVPSVANDTLGFTMTGCTSSSFGNLVSGSVILPNNMANPCFGLGSGVTSALLDGLRCAGGTVIRHGSRSSDAAGVIGNGVANPGLNGWGRPFPAPPAGLIAQGAFVSGQTRFFQVFYRTNATLGCLTGQNTSQAVQVDITM